MYNESGNIDKLFTELEKTTQILEKNYDIEIICVNDASRDNTLEKLLKISQSNKKLKIISLAKNFHHQISVTVGQDHAKGDAVIIMDADLQDPPSLAIEMIQKWEEGYDIVYAKRNVYKTHPVKKALAWAFYRILKSIANVDVPVDTGDFRLLSKRVNEEMRLYKEKSRYLRGMTSLMGYKYTFVTYDRGQRFAGVTNYPFQKSLKLALDGITGFSTYPLQLITKTGIYLAIFGFLLGVAYIIYSIISKTQVQGWASLMFVVMLLGGIQLFMLGIIGEYIGRIYTEVLDRPLYTIAFKKGFEDNEITEETRQRIH
jgi:polyisoprenyl-phosphate glycosyltransferase